jgi:hypothetical protein
MEPISTNYQRRISEEEAAKCTKEMSKAAAKQKQLKTGSAKFSKT